MSGTLILLAVCYAVLLCALRFGFGRTVRADRPRRAGELPSVSVVVPARNEEKSIVTCLSSIAKCVYPGQLEVVVVDCGSIDQTVEVASAFCESEKAAGKFRLLSANQSGNKISALFEAIGETTGEIILTTDSDCHVGSDWINQMVMTFSDSVGIVAGPVVYEHEALHNRGGLFAKLQALEFAGLVGVGAASLGLGFPTICNSANLAYRRIVFNHFRPLFLESRFAGADEMMLQLVRSQLKLNPVFCSAATAYVYAKPVSTVRAFFRQRIRWASGPVNFPSLTALGVGVGIYSLFALLLAGPLLCVFGLLTVSSLVWAIALKITGDAIFLAGPIEHFGLSRLMKMFLPFQVVHVPYVLIAASLGTLSSLTRRR